MTVLHPTYNATINVPLGRGGKYGTMAVDLGQFAPMIHDHVYEYGLRQILNDAMADKTDDDGNALSDEAIVAKAQKRLDTLYSGELRTHRASSEPTDPVEREAFRVARERIEAGFRLMKIWPAKGKDKFDAAVAERAKQLGTEMNTEQYILGYLDKNPKVRAEAKKTVAQRAKDVVEAGELV